MLRFSKALKFLKRHLFQVRASKDHHLRSNHGAGETQRHPPHCQPEAVHQAVAQRRLRSHPSGHIAVCVGAQLKRFVFRASYLNHPLFASLLAQAEEELGFASQGPLVIPCDESTFEEEVNNEGENKRRRTED
uniref:SAUR family protein n=1 Tax=Kalanchoe fedtschenkoi TaxID=63787 RepID=A0A7N0TVR1_KALFE